MGKFFHGKQIKIWRDKIQKEKQRSNYKNVYCFYPVSIDQFVNCMRWEPKNPSRNGQLKVKNLLKVKNN